VTDIDKLAQRYPQKRVLITGATSGLGESLAMIFAAANFRVAVASRTPAKVAATCEKVEKAGGSPLAITLDVNRLEDFDAAAKQVEEAWGGLDILINNAGILTSGKVVDIGLEEWLGSPPDVQPSPVGCEDPVVPVAHVSPDFSNPAVLSVPKTGLGVQYNRV